jgi:hypothetical protein
MNEYGLIAVAAAFLLGVVATARWRLGPPHHVPPGSRRGWDGGPRHSHAHQQRMAMLEKRLGSKDAVKAAMRKHHPPA